eukprot:s966_g18.t1
MMPVADLLRECRILGLSTSIYATLLRDPMRTVANESWSALLVLLAISRAAADSSCSLPGFQEQKAPVLLQLAASASARSAEGSLTERLFAAGDAAGRGATQLGPPAIAMSAIALAQQFLWGRHEELQSPRLVLQQMQQEVEDHVVTSQPTSAGSDTAALALPIIVAVAALVLAVTIVACLVTYQPKPDYSDSEQAILRTSLQQQQQERMRHEARQEACAC